VSKAFFADGEASFPEAPYVAKGAAPMTSDDEKRSVLSVCGACGGKGWLNAHNPHDPTERVDCPDCPRTSDVLPEVEVEAGERIDAACRRLSARAPAFMVFNDTRVEAALGDTSESLFRRWTAARSLRHAVHNVLHNEAMTAIRERDAARAVVVQIRNVMDRSAINVAQLSVAIMKVLDATDIGTIGSASRSETALPEDDKR
jgi:hypothetical protein